ncbi:LuxR C-terminal-related transcriptional regulator [Micromonospora sp. NPDC049559]|uniref:helix-turn-helix transcriptional regulator n=1 Tax=Micromonospora sp. NPDC049559 TaxID=3155923 RepID=UPI0034126B54
MLEPLGIDALSEQVYRSMLSYPDEGVPELAVRHGVSEAQIRLSLEQLSTLSLIHASRRRGSGFYAVSPDIAMELLLTQQQARLAAEQLKVEASRVAAAHLIAEYSATVHGASGPDSERLTGVEAIRERLAHLARTSQYEILTFAPGGAHSVEDLRAARAANTALLQRGVRSRTVYLDSVRNDPPTLEHVNWLISRGAQARTTVALPTRLIIVDRNQALLPIDTADTKLGAVLIWNKGALAALCALFDAIWAEATPLGTKQALDGQRLPRQEAEVLRLLATGLTDVAIANRLGVSPRTARRIAAELMERLEARSRFEAGVRAVQNGWLPQER